MEFYDTLQNSLLYIEAHLQQQLSVAEIAAAVGYSEYHFSRIFRKSMGCSVMDYVKKRRLIKASLEILNGKRILNSSLRTSPIPLADRIGIYIFASFSFRER